MYENNKRTLYSYFTSPNDIKNSLYKIEPGKKTTFGGVPLFYENDSVYIDNTDTHTFIVGATGSKKTRLIGMPSLQLFVRAGESFIASDPKGELYERTYSLLQEQGYNVIVINLRDPKKSNGWNPFTVPYKLLKSDQRDRCIEIVTDMANCIIQGNLSREPYWENSAADLLTGLILIMLECAEENEIHLKSLRTLYTDALKRDYDSKNNTSDYTPPFIKDNFLDHLDKSIFLFSLINGTVEVCDHTRGCILSTFDQAMRPFFSQNNLIDMLSASDFNMKDIGKTKTAVFLITPDENTLYHRLISIFVKQCYTELIYEAQNQPNKKLPRRVNFLLDEFSSLPTISDFPTMITASRSRNIRFHLFVQGVKQLEQRYGRDAETIRGNCENWIFLHSREVSLLEELVTLSGKKNCDDPLVSNTMLQTLDKEKGEAFIMHKRLHPFIANLMDIDQFEKLFPVKGNVQYPENKHQAANVFDFEKFCNSKDSYFFSQLFDGKKMTEEEYYKVSEDDSYRPIFVSEIPSDDEIGDYIDRIGAI